MKTILGTLDFTAYEEYCKGLTTEAIQAALADIRASYDSARELDRADGGDRWGFYCDQASVLRKVLLSRKAETTKRDELVESITTSAAQRIWEEFDANIPTAFLNEIIRTAVDAGLKLRKP